MTIYIGNKDYNADVKLSAPDMTYESGWITEYGWITAKFCSFLSTLISIIRKQKTSLIDKETRLIISDDCCERLVDEIEGRIVDTYKHYNWFRYE